MEFHIPKTSDGQCFQQSFDFSSQDLADIPCPDDICTQGDGSPEEDDELLLPPGTSIDDFPDLPLPPSTSGGFRHLPLPPGTSDFPDLPLPPGTSGEDLPIPLPPMERPFNISNNFCPSLPKNKAFENTSNLLHVEPENFNILPLDEDSQQKSDIKIDDFQEDMSMKHSEFLDDSKYSPSKVDSDEENQDFTTAKPKVLGKEQAKKRLMAFSLSKQPTVSVKKQSKAITPAKNKEKPPNPNKGSNVQEQFRATISAIEEEKKKMFQNMPSYLLLEMSELAKSSHSSMLSSIKILEKLKNENAGSKSKDNSGKEGSTSNKSNEGKSKRGFRKSRSRSKSKRPRRSRSKRRSRSRTKRSHSRSRRSSYSRSHSRRSRDKNSKTDSKNRQPMSKKKLFEDWNSFKAAGSILESEPGPSKNRSDELKSRRDEHHKRSRSPNDRPEYKPIFNYFNKVCNFMTSLQAKPADHGSSSPVFLGKTIKYTRTKPILCWAENPSRATEFYMTKQMLLENCDEATGPLLLFIIESKKLTAMEEGDIAESIASKTRPWYPREDYLLPPLPKSLVANETEPVTKAVEADDFLLEDRADDQEESSPGKEGAKRERVPLERKISLVNDSYLSDEEEQLKEMIVGELKVQLDLDMNRVKVRSRWDSDYEGENSEKDSMHHKKAKREATGSKIQIEGSTSQGKDILMDEFDVEPCQEIEHDSMGKKKSTPLNLSNIKVLQPDSLNLEACDGTTGNLVSEYEEFLKMVSVDSSDNLNNQKDKIMLMESKPKAEKPKVKKIEKSSEEDHQKVQGPKLGATDWDQDSDHEEKSISEKVEFTGTGSHDEFLILSKNENADATLEKNKKKAAKKKSEKSKTKKKKLLKKSLKTKKGKFEDSFTEDDSSSESYESDSDSDSDESGSKKNKKKKVSKSKKKPKKDSSSESDSDSDSSKTRKKKQMKKKGRKKKSSSSDEKEEVQTALLKQLDFKKQLIMKKIEEIDSIGDKGSKKKDKESRGKKREKEGSEETDSDKYIKSGKKKKAEGKIEKEKKKSKYASKKGKLTGKSKKLKKSKSSSESDSETDSDSESSDSDDSMKKKKNKKSGKRKRYTSESSGSEEKPAKHKSKSSSKMFKKAKKAKKDSSSSDSDDSDESSRGRKIKKKGKKVKTGDEKLDRITELSNRENDKENLSIEEPGVDCEERSAWEEKKSWKKSEGKIKKVKEDDDWEASSSVEESEQDRKTRESSWDEEVRDIKALVSENSLQKADKRKTPVTTEKEISIHNSTDTSEANNQLTSETLKTSLSNFSFNENSFCSFGQELSRDFFLAERSYSNSGNLSNSESFKTTLIEPRPFQSVSKDTGVKKPAGSELYSPGYSDSELSEAEMNKPEKTNSNSNAENRVREDIYDPLNCDSEGSVENNEMEVSSIPLPHAPDILLPGESKRFENVGAASSSNSEGSVIKDLRNEMETVGGKLPCMTPPIKSCFTSSDFTPVAASQSPLTEEKNTPTKRQVMSVKGQQKLISKAASVFQDESDEENIEPVTNREKTSENTHYEASVSSREKSTGEAKGKKEEKHSYKDEKEKDHGKKRKKETRDKSRERSSEREGRRRRSRSRESRESSKTYSKKTSSPRKRKSKTPEVNREKREIRSDSFEIEPLKSSIDANELTDMIQPIPVLTGLEPSSEGLWSRSIVPGCEFPHTTDNLIDHAESFDIYPSEESNFRHKNYDKDYGDHDKSSVEKSKDQKSKKERRKSRSRSYSPKKKLRSKSPERRKSPRNRSPRRKSASPKRRDKSPLSPRRRSPKRKSPSRRYKISRSPDKRRKSSSRSPRKRRGSPSRRSRSASPRKYRSPKHREESPKRKESPSRAFGSRDRFSPRSDLRYNQPYPDGLRIPVIGASSEDIDMELSPSKFEGRMGFPRHLPDSSVTEPEMYSSFYEGEYPNEFGVRSYPEEVGVNNLITVKNHDIEKPNSPERLSLDQRIELELGVQMSGSQAQSEQYQIPNQVCPPFQEINQSHFPNTYNCENSNLSNDNFYHNQNIQMNTDFNGQYFNGHPQPASTTYGSFQQYPNSQSAQNSVLQVGNIVEVVPTLQHPPPPPPIPPKTPQIMQVGNVLQVVPAQKANGSVPSTVSLNYGPPDASPMVKTQKATAVVAPSSIVPTPNPEAVLNPLIKAIQLEREKRRKEKEKRKAEREARRKARQLRREAKLLSVNEKLKKSVQNEGLMLGQEVEDDELLESLDVPSPPIPVEIITVSSISALPPAGKGILITAGFMPKPPSEKKEVKFADGVCPGEGTSTSGGEDIASPPPKPKLPKEKRFKKKKTKVKKKVKVQIIRQIIQQDDDDEEDDLSPPPPPPGDPPLVFFAKFPFAGDAQFPVYQTQTTTTTLTTVQYPAQTFE